MALYGPFSHYGQRAARTGLDHICQIQLLASISVPFFQRKPRPYCAKPTLIRSGQPGQVLAKCNWSESKLVCKTHQARFLAECNRPATSSPLSVSVAFFHRGPGSYCAKPARIWFGSGWLCRVWAKRFRSGSKLVCKNHLAHFWSMLPSRCGSDANRIQHVYRACTNTLLQT